MHTALLSCRVFSYFLSKNPIPGCVATLRPDELESSRLKSSLVHVNTAREDSAHPFFLADHFLFLGIPGQWEVLLAGLGAPVDSGFCRGADWGSEGFFSVPHCPSHNQSPLLSSSGAGLDWVKNISVLTRFYKNIFFVQLPSYVKIKFVLS